MESTSSPSNMNDGESHRWDNHDDVDDDDDDDEERASLRQQLYVPLLSDTSSSASDILPPSPNDDQNSSTSSSTPSSTLLLENDGSDDLGRDTPATTTTTTTTTTTIRRIIMSLSSSTWMGPLLLFFASFLYATMNISTRSLYRMSHPLSPQTMTTIRGWFVMVLFVPLFVGHQQRLRQKKRQQRQQRTSPATTTTTTTATTTTTSDNVAEINVDSDSSSNSSTTNSSRPEEEETPRSSLWGAAMELAIWNFFGQLFYSIGMTFVPSARASFLGQTTIVLVPLISSLGGEPLYFWDGMGCLSSLIGMILLMVQHNGDNATGGDESSPPSSYITADNHHYGVGSSLPHLHLGWGDALILASAVSWSFYLISTSKYAHIHDTIYLQSVKNGLNAIMYTLWWVVASVEINHEGHFVWKSDDDNDTSTIERQSIMAWLILIYSAWGPGVLADLVQQKGQVSVGATESNLILSMESVFTAILGRVLLGEQTSAMEKLGGFFLAIGAFVAGRGDTTTTTTTTP